MNESHSTDGLLQLLSIELLQLLSIAWVFVISIIGLVLQIGDSSSGRGNSQSYLLTVYGFYLISGLIFAVLTPRAWKFAAFCIWAIALAWIVITMTLLDIPPTISWINWTVRLFGKMVLVPLLAALAGGYIGMRLRTYGATVSHSKPQ